MLNSGAEESIGRLAAQQAGLIHWRQLQHLGVRGGTVAHQVKRHRLLKVLPCVYAVGHTAPSRQADLWAAVLYAGPGAALSHLTAGHLVGIVDRPPALIDVTTPRRIRSIANITVHAQRSVGRVVHRDGIPTTALAQTVLDIAARADRRTLERALAQLDYRRELDVERLCRVCGPGRAGSVALRAALQAHDPKLKWANGTLECDFLQFCRRERLPTPLLNPRLHGIRVDAYWPSAGHVVELDGSGNHATVGQLRRDRANDLRLRAHGLTVTRYDWALIHGPARAQVAAELRARVC